MVISGNQLIITKISRISEFVNFHKFFINRHNNLSNHESEQKSVSPVWQFVSLLAPIVLTGFYLVYALVGLFIEGQSKLKWSDEALTVGLRVTVLIFAMNGLVMAYAFFCRVGRTHLLWLSPLTHIAIAVGLTIMIALVAL